MAELRKLATIMSVDVAGYSRMAEASDSAAAEAVMRLKNALAAIAAPLSGRIFNTAGDGVMLEFPVASAGVQAALQLLAETTSGERPLPRVRVGLHLGEVIVAENGDLLGHGVNIAARLQALAAPGTAMVSLAVQAQVRSAFAAEFVPQGRVHLDKMSETMEVFTLAAPGVKTKTSRAMRLRQTRRAALIGGAALGVAALATTPFLLTQSIAPSRPITPSLRMPRLAVLRLKRLGDVEPYFADGLAEELINEVARIDGLETVGRTSSFSLEGKDATPEGAARLLGATIMLEGSIRRVSESVRVNARLLEAPGGRQIWAETFEKTSSDLFILQRRIALRVSQALSLRVSGTPPRRVDPAAFELYLRGMLTWRNFSNADYKNAKKLFALAVQRDSKFAAAWGRLAEATAWSENLDQPTDIAEAQAAVDRALALDPQLAQPHYTKADLEMYLGHWRSAIQNAERASDLGGTEPEFVHASMGYLRDGVSIARQSTQIDPINSDSWRTLADHLLFYGDYAGAIQAEDRASEIAVRKRHWLYMEALLASGRKAEARAYIESNPDYLRLLKNLEPPLNEMYMYWRCGEGHAPPIEPALQRLKAGTLQRSSVIRFLANVGAVGDVSKLLDNVADHWTSFDLFDVRRAEIRKLPAFWRLMDRIGLSAYWRESGKWPDFCAVDKVCPK